jgi:hypothetical protein
MGKLTGRKKTLLIVAASLVAAFLICSVSERYIFFSTFPGA